MRFPEGPSKFWLPLRFSSVCKAAIAKSQCACARACVTVLEFLLHVQALYNVVTKNEGRVVGSAAVEQEGGGDPSYRITAPTLYDATTLPWYARSIIIYAGISPPLLAFSCSLTPSFSLCMASAISQIPWPF